MSFYKNKNVLVTGGTGMIGRSLCEMLISFGANVTVASLDDESSALNGTKFLKLDLRSFDNCLEVSKNQDIVFHLAGVKGSPKVTKERPATFLVPIVQFSFNMMEAARINKVERYLFTSSVGVYQPAKVLHEESVWKTNPGENDWFAGWGKRVCELQAEAYKIEYGWDKISIVRPANVYGPFDNFGEGSMVIPSLISRAINEKGRLLSVWGDGSPIRDFIHCSDVAKGMLLAVEKGINVPMNLGSGSGITIKSIAEIVGELTGKEIIWDFKKPMGDKQRILDTEVASSYGFECSKDLYDGIKETIDWYKNEYSKTKSKYNPFTEQKLLPQ